MWTCWERQPSYPCREAALLTMSSGLHDHGLSQTSELKAVQFAAGAALLMAQLHVGDPAPAAAACVSTAALRCVHVTQDTLRSLCSFGMPSPPAHQLLCARVRSYAVKVSTCTGHEHAARHGRWRFSCRVPRIRCEALACTAFRSCIRHGTACDDGTIARGKADGDTLTMEAIRDHPHMHTSMQDGNKHALTKAFNLAKCIRPVASTMHGAVTHPPLRTPGGDSQAALLLEPRASMEPCGSDDQFLTAL